MRHLNLETIARLVDESPSSEEAAHLAACEECAGELHEMKLQTARLGGLSDPPLPDEIRRRVANALAAEPVTYETPPAAGPRWLRAAAGIALFLLGGLAGAIGVSSRAPQTTAAGSEYEAPPEDVTAAAAALATAEADYLRALAEYSRLTTSDDPIDPLNRLAALEGIVLTTRSALREAPADPVINSYHLTALGQRDALLDQLEAATIRDEWF